MALEVSKPTLKGKDDLFLNLNDKVQIRTFVTNIINICKLESMSPVLVTELESHCFTMVHSFTMKYSKLNSDSTRMEFRDASKRHQRQLNNIITEIISVLLRECSDELTFEITNSKVRIKISNQTIFEEDVRPRSFLSWYKALAPLTKLNENTRSDLVLYSRMLTSIYNIVNEPILRPSEMQRISIEELDSIMSNPKFTTRQQYMSNDVKGDHQLLVDDIKETIRILNNAIVNRDRDIPLWSTDILSSVRRLQRNRQLFLYDNNSPLLSSNSTGTMWKPYNQFVTLPGLFASGIEKDFLQDDDLAKEFDNITGFDQSYGFCTDFPFKVKSERRKSVIIEQRKPKPRVIHILNNSEQDRALYYHNISSRILNSMSNDCTFNQKKGPDFIQDTMSNKPNESIYSLDLTSATNTFNIGLQYLVVRDIMLATHDKAEILSDFWLQLMTDPSWINQNGIKGELTFGSGQPQGYLSSFAVFALSHHIVALTVLRKWDTKLSPNEFYRILGDDLVLTAYDPEFKLPGLYQDYIQAANVECNMNKGYIYNPDIPNYNKCVAEFAKHLLINGIDMSPIPTKLLMSDSISELIGLLSWYSEHRESLLTIENLLYFLEISKVPEYEYIKIPIMLMAELNIPSVFSSSFKRKLNRIGNFTKMDLILVQNFSYQTIMYGVINRIVSNKPFDITFESLFHLLGEYRLLYDTLLKDVPLNNKLEILRSNLGNYNNILLDIINNYDSDHKFDDSDIEIISLFLSGNNDLHIKEDVSDVWKLVDLLSINPTEIQDNLELNNLVLELLALLKTFNISLDRSWSSYDRKVPVEYLVNSAANVFELFDSLQLNLQEYLDSSNILIESEAVQTQLFKNTSVHDSTEDDFENIDDLLYF